MLVGHLETDAFGQLDRNVADDQPLFEARSHCGRSREDVRVHIYRKDKRLIVVESHVHVGFNIVYIFDYHTKIVSVIEL